MPITNKIAVYRNEVIHKDTYICIFLDIYPNNIIVNFVSLSLRSPLAQSKKYSKTFSHCDINIKKFPCISLYISVDR